MKPMTWLTALRRVTIMSKPRSTTESAKARSSRAIGSAAAVAGSMTVKRQSDETDAEEHGDADAADDLDLAMDSKTHNDALQAYWDNQGLEDDRDRGRHEEMRGVLGIRLPANRKRQNDGMQGEDVDQSRHAVLIEKHEAD